MEVIKEAKKRRTVIEIEITQTEKYGTVKNTLTVPQCFINLYDLIRNSYFKNSSRFVCSFPTPVLPYFLRLLQHSISLWQQNKCSERCYSTHCTVASQKCYRLVKHKSYIVIFLVTALHFCNQTYNYA